jgi:hypothetical protein
MWPYRPEKLTDVLSPEDLSHLLGLGSLCGSALTLVERSADGAARSIDAAPRAEEARPDPFCTYFRHGVQNGKPAFAGADEACARCEQAFARRLLAPSGQAPAHGSTGPQPAGDAAPIRHRCHMGLSDFQVPVAVAGKVVAGLIAGRRVESEDDRHRIRKSVGKLGKLTRAEAESEAERLVIEPADERARERLIQEIGAIPLRGGGLESELRELGRFLGSLATRQFEGARRAWEDAIVERIDARPREEVRDFAGLRRDLQVVLDELRGELDVEYLAFFAHSPKELDDVEARASLLAESGLGTGAARRFLELDWSRLPIEKGGQRSAVARGLESVSAAINALVPLRDSPEGLKDRLTKAAFFSPVEMGSHLRSALAVGRARSAVPPGDRDWLFLARLARAVSRRYFALAAEIERRWLSEHLSAEEAKRREADAARKELAKTAGFTYFDVRKLVNQCLERARKRIEERGVEVDAKALLDRLNLRGDRQALLDAFHAVLAAGVERTRIDPETRKGSPLRVFLRRTRDRVLFGVEAVGDFLEPGERRLLFEREGRDGNGAGGPRSPAGPSGRSARPSHNPAAGLSAAADKLRRHEGRLRVESERLHRDEKDARRWIGRTVFIADLPLPGRPEPPRGAGAEAAAETTAASEEDGRA